VTAQNGTVAIAPLTTARGMSLDSTRSGTTLSLLQSDLNQINAGTVALGSMDGGANLLAASLTVNSPMTFNGIAGTLGLFASGNISEVGAGALTVATLTGRTGTNALLAGSNSINALGNFVAASGFTLIDAPGLTVNADSAVNGGTNVTIIDSGLLTITGSVLGTTVDLTGSNIDIPGSVDGPTSVSLKATPGGLTETGSLATALLTGSAATSATLSGATPTANLISNLGPFTDTSGGFSLATAGPLTVAGAVTTKGNVSLQATGDLSVSNPVVAADSNIVMHAGHNLTISTPLSASGILYLKANTANDPANPGNFMINAPVSGGTVYLASTSNLGIKIDQPVTSTGASPLITVACDCLIKSDPPLPQVLLQAPGGTIEYGPATNGFNQTIVTHDENVFEAALLRFGLSHDPINGTQALAGTLTVGDIAGAISLDGRALDLNASGAITQRAGTFFTDVATLTGAAGSANLTEVSNAIATLGAFSTTAGFALVNNKPLLVAGPVQDTGGASTLALTTKTGDIALAGNVNATNVVDLISAGAISQTGGSLIAGTLTGSAATSASLTQPTNLIDALGAFSTTAGFALVNNKPLLVAGPVQDTGGASTLALATKTGDIALAGNVSATNVVDLISAGAISQTGGSLVARALTGSAGSSSGVTLTSDNVISFFGPFTATSGAIELMDSIPLTINGALTARLIFITATGSISLASDITTGGLASLTTVPTDPLASLGGALFFVAPDLNGNSSFTASTSVSSLSDTGTLLFVSMPPQVGNVGLTNLNAPDTELLLNLGSGNASGQVNVGSLFVLGAGGQVNFTNSTVQGLTGSAAALVAQSFPAANSAYLINGCEIGVGCGSIIGPPQRPPESLSPLLSPELLAQGVSVSTGISNIVSSLVDDASIAPFQSSQETNPRGVPVLNPMRDLFSGPLRDRQDDPDLLLPNVSEKDY
jgi:hypothetical protein